MIEILGNVIGALGLFFAGMWFLTENLKTLANRRLRMMAARWTGNPGMAFAWGSLLGGITQNMPAVVFIAVGMMQSGILSVRRALPVILGASFGTSLLVFVVTFDIELVSLYVLGIASAIMVSARASRFRPLAASLFGMGMLIFGLVLLKDLAQSLDEASLDGYPWFDAVKQWPKVTLMIFSFLCAAALTFIVQSANAVCILGITMAKAMAAHLNLTIDEIIDLIIMFIYGSYFGSALILYVISSKLSGSSRQIAMYMFLYSITYCAVMVPLLYVELHFGVPLMKAAVLSFDHFPLERQLSLIAVFSDPLWLPVTMSTLKPCGRFLERRWPKTKLEEQSSMKFAHDHSFGDVETSLVLVDLEQRRLLMMLSGYFNAVREGASLDPLRKATRELFARIREFLNDLEVRYPNQDAEDINSKLTRHKLLSWLEEQLADLCEALQGTTDYPALGNLRTSLVEGIDAVLLVMIHSLDPRHEDFRPIVKQLTDEQGETLRKVRDSYLDATPSLDDAARARVYKIASIAEQVFYLLSKVKHELHNSPDLHGESARKHTRSVQ